DGAGFANPVMMVDPDGEFVVPMLFGAAISVFTNGINNISSGQGFFKGAGKAAGLLPAPGVVAATRRAGGEVRPVMGLTWSGRW
ncbi:MAG: hypothetical protein MUF64_04445, partial [Polyangiaceae bacterium]|nr:hypothetical protein [Polyangiaceae bacterium]